MFSNAWLASFLVAMAAMAPMASSRAQAQARPHAETAKEKSRPTINGKAESANMTNAQAWKVYEKYLEGWKDVSDEQRAKIAADILAECVQLSLIHI